MKSSVEESDMSRSAFQKNLFGVETLEDGWEEVSLRIAMQVRDGEGLS